jgi:hypothetical protein
MNRQQLISRLIARKLESANAGRIGCVPCLGAAGRIVTTGPAETTRSSPQTVNRTD